MPLWSTPSRPQFGLGGKSKNLPIAARTPLFAVPGPESADNHDDHGDPANYPYPQTPRRSPYLEKYGIQSGYFQADGAQPSQYAYTPHESHHERNTTSFGQSNSQDWRNYGSLREPLNYPSDDLDGKTHRDERSRMVSEPRPQREQRTLPPQTFTSQRSQISKSQSLPQRGTFSTSHPLAKKPTEQGSWRSIPSAPTAPSHQSDRTSFPAERLVKASHATQSASADRFVPAPPPTAPLSNRAKQFRPSDLRAHDDSVADDYPVEQQKLPSDETHAAPETYCVKGDDVSVLDPQLYATPWAEGDYYPQEDSRRGPDVRWMVEDPETSVHNVSQPLASADWYTSHDQHHPRSLTEATGPPPQDPPKLSSLSQIFSKQHQSPKASMKVGPRMDQTPLDKPVLHGKQTGARGLGATAHLLGEATLQSSVGHPMSQRPPTPFADIPAAQDFTKLTNQVATIYDKRLRAYHEKAMENSSKLSGLQSELSAAEARLYETEEKLRQTTKKSTDDISDMHKLLVDTLLDFAREGIVDQGPHEALVARDTLNKLNMRELRNLFMDSCRGAIATCTEQRVQVKSQSEIRQNLIEALQSAGLARADQLTLLSTGVQEGQRKQSDQLLELKELFGQKEEYDAKIHTLEQQLAHKLAHVAKVEEQVDAKEGAIQRHIQQLVELLAAIGVPDSLVAEQPQEALRFLRERWETQLKIHETSLASLQTVNARCEKELERCRDELASARQESARASGHYEKLQDSLSSLGHAIQANSAKCQVDSSEKDKRQASERALADMAQQVAQLRTAAEAARAGYENAQLSLPLSAQANVIELQSQLDSANEHEKAVAKQVEDFRIQISTFTNLQSDLEQQLDRAKQENTRLQGGNALTNSQRNNAARFKAQNVELMQRIKEKDALLRQALDEKESFEQRLGQLHQQSIQAEKDSGTNMIERYETNHLKECESAFVQYLMKELKETAEAEAEQAGSLKYRDMESEINKLHQEAAKERKEIVALRRQLAELKSANDKARRVRDAIEVLSDTDEKDEEDNVLDLDMDVDAAGDDVPQKPPTVGKSEKGASSQRASHRSSTKRARSQAPTTVDKSSTSQNPSKKVRFDSDSAIKTAKTVGVSPPKATDNDNESSTALDNDGDGSESEIPLPPATQKNMRAPPTASQRPQGRRRQSRRG